eukprot:1158773-Pelagomonas_calceolata.AAC.15
MSIEERDRLCLARVILHCHHGGFTVYWDVFRHAKVLPAPKREVRRQLNSPFAGRPSLGQGNLPARKLTSAFQPGKPTSLHSDPTISTDIVDINSGSQRLSGISEATTNLMFIRWIVETPSDLPLALPVLGQCTVCSNTLWTLHETSMFDMRHEEAPVNALTGVASIVKVGDSQALLLIVLPQRQTVRHGNDEHLLLMRSCSRTFEQT